MSDSFSLSHNNPFVTIGVYLLVVGLLDWLAYHKFNERWKRRERARIVIGVLVVHIPALLLSVVGLLDIYTLLVLFSGFGLAGAITIYLDIERETSQADDLRNMFHDKGNQPY